MVNHITNKQNSVPFVESRRLFVLVTFVSATGIAPLFNSCQTSEFSRDEKSRIDRFIRGLGSTEQEELGRRFTDYIRAYTIYNTLQQDPDHEYLFYKFYGLFGTSCSTFIYEATPFTEGGARASVERQYGTQNYIIRYAPTNMVDDTGSLHPREVFRYGIYGITDPKKFQPALPQTNLKQLISEVAHLKHYADFWAKTFSYRHEIAIINSFFPGFNSLDWAKDKKLISSVEDKIVYIHSDCNEFYTHTVIERAIWFYLLDIFPGKQFEEIKNVFINIYEKVNNCNGLASPFGKAAIISAMCMPEVVKAIMSQGLRASSYIDFILLGIEPLKKVISAHKIDTDTEYLFFELLNHTSTPKELEALVYMDSFIDTTQDIVQKVVENQLSQDTFGALPYPQKILAAVLLKNKQYENSKIPQQIKSYADIGNFAAVHEHLNKINQNFQQIFMLKK